MSLEGAKKPDHLITVLQELIKMLLMLQDNTCSLSSFIASYGFVQKWRIIHMLNVITLKVVQLN
jgi:hypothetical protein